MEGCALVWVPSQAPSGILESPHSSHNFLFADRGPPTWGSLYFPFSLLGVPGTPIPT